MFYRPAFACRLFLLVILLVASVFQPQRPAYAASSLTIVPITWNVVGLDSNNVNVGPNNFPVGVRACNPAGSTTSVNGANATFTWTTGNANINLRPGSLNPINPGINLVPGQCYDFYFEVSVTRTTAAWNTARQYRIDVAGIDSGTGTPVAGSTSIPSEIYVEKLVSQNRNFVRDIALDGVSIAAGGSMNLMVGNTYTIQLVGATATNGYEQIESFINFPNTIFKVNSVTATYTAFPNPHTDPSWASKLYANGCGWISDPISPNYRSCSGTGKYGGDITITYNVTIIGGGGTSQTLNTLIYDFSGSSYHYNSDFSASSRIAVITDPSSCALGDSSMITQWTFAGNTTTASTNPGPSGGVFTAGSGITFVPYATNPSYTPAANPPLSFEGWTSIASFDANDYYQFSVPTVGYNGTWLTLYVRTSNAGFESADLKYSTDGVNFTNFVSWTDLSTTWQQKTVNLSSITGLNNQINRVYFRLYGYSSGNANRDLSVDDVTIRGCQIPSALSLAKSGSPSYFTGDGQNINYSYTLTNTGSTTLYPPYEVSDNKVTVSCPGTPAQLAFGDSVTCTASYTTTTTDISNQGLTNLATATAQANYGGTLTAVSSNQVEETVEYAALNIIKDVSTSAAGPWSDSITVNVGAPVYFQITVDNSGAADLTGVIVDDGMAGCTLAGPSGDTDEDNILDATETWFYTCLVTAVAGTNTNTATADTNETLPDTDTASYLAAAPALTIVKLALPGVYTTLGELINYTYEVTNSGNVPLDGLIVVADDKATDEACPATVTLAPGASITCTASYRITQADLDNGSVTNVASASGSYNGTPVISPTDTETVTAIQNPLIVIVKSVTETSYATVGSVLHYSYQVINRGNVTLSGPLTVTDDKAADETCPATATLAPGASITCTATYTVTQADLDSGSVTNIASSHGFFGGSAVNSTTDTETVNATQNPALTIIKTASPVTYSSMGAVINYSYLVTNSGTVTLTGPITVADDKATNEDCPTVATFAPGANITCTASYTITQSDLDAGSVTNVASASGSFNGTPVTSPTDTETVNATQNSALTIVKTASPSTYNTMGSLINYTYQLTNSGNVTLSGPFTVADDKATDESCPATATLTPGASITCTASYSITQADLDAGSVTNIASATGSYNGTPVTSPTDTETVTASQNPALTIVKTASPPTYSVADAIINYSYQVTNSGNVTLSGPFTITDDKSTDESCPATVTLTPGSSITCTASYRITQADLDNGSVTNVASATGSFAGNQITSPDDTVTVNAVQTRGINIEKTPASQIVASGGTATFTLTVTNTGNMTLTGISVTDTICTSGPTRTGGDTNGDDQLQITETWTYSCSVANVTQDLTNTADVSTAEEATDSDTASVTVAAAPALNIVKEVSSSANGPWNDTSITVTVGDKVYYRVRVANTGNTPLTGLTVDDGMLGCTLVRGSDITGNNDNAFEVGDEWAYTCSVTAVMGTNNNTATADTNETSPDSDTASYIGTAASVADPAISKAGNPTQASVGETVTFTLTVTNNGNAPATNVVITDVLPVMFDGTAVNVSGAPFGTLVSVTPLVGTGPAPYTVVVTLGGDLGVTDVVTIMIVTTVNSLGNPPINNTASLTTSSLSDVIANNSATFAITTQTTTRTQRTVLPATGFARDVVTLLPEQPYVLAYASTDLVVEIPSLGIKIPIVGVPKRNGTWNVSWLGNQAGWLQGSAFPSWSGNSVLTGHVYLSNGLPGPFVSLHKLKYGDKIIIHAYGQKYTFAVQTNTVVEPADSSVMKHEEKPWLTLVTCKEYDEKTNTYKKRVIVRAALVDVEWE